MNLRPILRLNTSKTKSPSTQCQIPEVTPHTHHSKNLNIYIPIFRYAELRKTKPNQRTNQPTKQTHNSMGQIPKRETDNYVATQEITHIYRTQRSITLITAANHCSLNKPDVHNYCPCSHSIPLNPF
jgi:hypothetical protein